MMSRAQQEASNGSKSMMQLEEITPPDPRLAGWNADDAPARCRQRCCRTGKLANRSCTTPHASSGGAP